MLNFEPRLAPIATDDETRIDKVELGRIESKHCAGQPLTAAEEGVLAALIEQLGGQAGYLLHDAVVHFDAWAQQQVREHGGEVERVHVRLRDIAHWREKQELHGEPHDSEQFERDLFSGRVRGAEVRVERYAPRAARTTTNGTVGRAPREATNNRRRGSRRGERARSSSSDDPEPEPAPARLCACGCGQDLDELGKNRDASYASKTHAKRGQRRRDREQPDRVVERWRAAGGELLWGSACECNGGHILERDDVAASCTKCGRARPWASLHPFDQIVYGRAPADSHASRPGYVQTRGAGRDWKRHLKRDESRELRRKDSERGYRFDRPNTKELS